MAGRRRRGAGALPCVDPDVVVVVAGGEEGGVQAALAAVGRHTEAERVAIERRATRSRSATRRWTWPTRTAGWTGSVCMPGSVPAAGGAVIGGIHLTGAAQAENRRVDATSPDAGRSRAGARGDRGRARRAARRRRRRAGDRGRAGHRQVAAARASRRAGRRVRGAGARAPRSSRPTCPYALWTEASTVAGGADDRPRARLADRPRGARASRRTAIAPHRALRDLLERLAAAPARAVPRRRALGRSGPVDGARRARAPAARRAGAARARRARAASCPPVLAAGARRRRARGARPARARAR